MLAARGEPQRVELGDQMAAGAVGADQHARAERIAGGIERFGLSQGAGGSDGCGERGGGVRPGAPPVPGAPGWAFGVGDHDLGLVAEIGEEVPPVLRNRGGVGFVEGVELSEIGGVGAVQERGVGENFVRLRIASWHQPCRSVLGPPACRAIKASVWRPAHL